MKRLRVNVPHREYDICVGEGLLAESGKLIREIYSGPTAVVVTDGNVYPLFYKCLADSLRGVGIEPGEIVIEPGEASKSQACLESLYDALFAMGVNRNSLIITLGGGVVGDLAGYAAATLMRGVPYVQIPTTMVAQADSGVGGKVGVNHPRGKNLIGAFYQPRLVIADTDCLKQLPERMFADGIAEVIKHGAIADAEFFALLESKQYNLTDMVARSYDIKRSVVEQDEYDMGVRMTLNFGHTFGHALEKFSTYGTYSHGEAVAIGMVFECGLGEKLGVTKPGVKERLEKVLASYGLPTSAGIVARELFNTMLFDKKRGGDDISIALLTEIGKCELHRIPVKKLEEIL